MQLYKYSSGHLSDFLFYVHSTLGLFSTAMFFTLIENIFCVTGVALQIERFEEKKYK